MYFFHNSRPPDIPKDCAYARLQDQLYCHNMGYFQSHASLYMTTPSRSPTASASANQNAVDGAMALDHPDAIQVVASLPGSPLERVTNAAQREIQPPSYDEAMHM